MLGVKIPDFPGSGSGLNTKMQVKVANLVQGLGLGRDMMSPLIFDNAGSGCQALRGDLEDARQF